MSTITNIQTQALKCFASGKYGECLTHLQKLKSTASHKSSLSVLQNIALVEYLHSYPNQPQRLSEDLSKLITRSTESKEPVTKSSERGKSEASPSYASYNRAVILYHMHRFEESVSILEFLLTRIDQFSYVLSVHVCFLLIQIYLIEYKQVDRTPKLLSLLEDILFDNHSLIESVRAVSKSNPTSAPDTKAPVEADLICMSPYSREPENYMLSRVGRESVDEFVVLNNIGCIYFQQKKYAASCLHFAKALSSIDGTNQSRDGGARPELAASSWNKGIFAQSRLRKYEVMYNLGIQHFMLGQFDMALQYLRACLAKKRTEPVIWLRISECCIGSYFSKKNVNLQTHAHESLHPFYSILGSGQYRKVKITHDQDIQMMSEMNTMEHMKPVSLLSYAIECVVSCIGIINRSSSATGPPQRNSPLSFAVHKGTAEDHLHIYQSAIVMLPYLYLEIGDATSALYWCNVANTLQIKEALDRSLIMMYMGEALCLLNRTEESQKCLMGAIELMANPKVSKGQSEDEERGLGRLYVPANMVALLRTNFVVALVLRGDFVTAEKTLGQVLELHPNFVPALLMFCFLNLRKGNQAVVLETLQVKCRNQFLGAQDSK